MIATAPKGKAPSRALLVSLWVAQILVGVPFVLIGSLKLLTPIPQLAHTIPWAGQLPVLFVRLMGVIDIAGGVGIILPVLTRIKPQLTVWAALGCVCLQVCAIVFHLSRGEVSAVPLNFVFLPLAAFVYWGRRKAGRRPG
jgi:uncharacterized membrane protein YphA (DoxX/SURF4 family)